MQDYNTLSPVKLSVNVLTNRKLSGSHTPKALIDQVDGMNERRNTIQSKKTISLVETPRNHLMNQDTLTSRKPNIVPHLESIKKAKLRFDTILRPDLGSDKENKNPFESSPSKDSTRTSIGEDAQSSPIKRGNENDEQPKKIRKVFTNANDISSYDEPFEKHDLVADMSTHKAVYDNDDDSDLEDYGRIESTISQTLMPNSSILARDLHPETVITPQRFTEPVAKSPKTNQQIRIHQEPANDDITSPLKTKKIVAEDDTQYKNNEPTINFYLSPNSKPQFSKEEISKIEQKYEAVSEGLRGELSQQAQKINELLYDVAQTDNEKEKLQVELRDLRHVNVKLLTNEEVVQMQLKFNERELASLTRKFKLQETKIQELNQEINQLNSQIEDSAGVINNLKIQKQTSDQEKSQLIEQLDEREKLVKEFENEFELKILQVEQELKIQQELHQKINQEKQVLADEIELLHSKEESFHRLEDKYVAKLDEFDADLTKQKEKVEQLQQKLDDKNQSIKNLNLKLDDLHQQKSVDVEKYQNKINVLTEELDERTATVNQLEETAKQDSLTIDDYLSKMKTMTESIDYNNARNAKQSKKIESLSSELKQASHELELYKSRFQTAKQDHESEIVYLHAEYTKKLQAKIQVIFDDLEKKRIQEKEGLTRDYDMLKRKMRSVEADNKHLIQIMNEKRTPLANSQNQKY